MLIERGFVMRGSIRTFLGLVLVLGAAGGLDTASDSELVYCVLVAFVGVVMMATGVSAMKSN
jgi:hypothetical protein